MKSRVFARTAVRKSNDNNQTDEEEERINKMQNGILCFVLHTFRWRIDRWTAYSNCRICLDYIFFFRFYFCHFACCLMGVRMERPLWADECLKVSDTT